MKPTHTITISLLLIAWVAILTSATFPLQPLQTIPPQPTTSFDSQADEGAINYTLIRLDVDLDPLYAGSWTIVAQQLQGSIANCFDAASSMLSNNDNTRFALLGAQTETQKTSDGCQENVIIPIVGEIDGALALNGFKNGIVMNNGADCLTSTSQSGPNVLICGEDCSPCAIGSLCDTPQECIYGQCSFEHSSDEFKTCVGSGMAIGLSNVIGIIALGLFGLSGL